MARAVSSFARRRSFPAGVLRFWIVFSVGVFAALLVCITLE
jgi:hypothetical protein